MADLDAHSGRLRGSAGICVRFTDIGGALLKPSRGRLRPGRVQSEHPVRQLLAIEANKYQGGHVSTAKDELTRLIQDQPEDSSAEEIVRELAFHVMVERGLADSDARRIVSNEETARRIRSWRS